MRYLVPWQEVYARLDQVTVPCLDETEALLTNYAGNWLNCRISNIRLDVKIRVSRSIPCKSFL